MDSSQIDGWRGRNSKSCFPILLIVIFNVRLLRSPKSGPRESASRVDHMTFCDFFAYLLACSPTEQKSFSVKFDKHFLKVLTNVFFAGFVRIRCELILMKAFGEKNRMLVRTEISARYSAVCHFTV